MASVSDSTSPARHPSTVSSSFPGHLGEHAAVGGHQRGAGAHGLDGGETESFVQARDHGHLGFGVELDDAVVTHAGHEFDVGAEP